jgi:hypothetical protein
MPNCARDQILVQRISCLLGSQDAAVDLLLQQRVVVRQLLELLPAQPIAARIADVANRHPVAAKHGGHDRRAHAGALRTRLRRLVDALVGGGDLLLQQQCTVREAALDIDLGQLSAGFQFRHHAVGHEVDGDAARHFAGAVSAHAVRQHRDAGVGIREDRVLVVRANHARMGQARDVEGRGIVHWKQAVRGGVFSPRV